MISVNIHKSKTHFSQLINQELQNMPVEAKSSVLIVDNPDAPAPKAPQRTWVHWVLYNIPPQVKGLSENVGVTDLPEGTLNGLNEWTLSET